MIKLNFKFFLQDESGRYSNTWTISTIDNNIYVLATCIAGTTKVSIYPTGRCQASTDLYLKNMPLPIHMPPTFKADRWNKQPVGSGLHRLLDIHMPHRLLSGNDRFRPSVGHKVSPVPGYEVTSIGIFESVYRREAKWALGPENYNCLHTSRLPNGRYLYVMVYGCSLDFSDCPTGDDEFFPDELSRYIKPYNDQQTKVGCFVDTIYNTGTAANMLAGIMDLLSGRTFE